MKTIRYELPAWFCHYSAERPRLWHKPRNSKVDGSCGVHNNVDTTGQRDFDSAIDGVEAMILNCHSAGIDITSEAFKLAVRGAVELIANHVL